MNDTWEAVFGWGGFAFGVLGVIALVFSILFGFACWACYRLAQKNTKLEEACSTYRELVQSDFLENHGLQADLHAAVGEASSWRLNYAELAEEVRQLQQMAARGFEETQQPVTFGSGPVSRSGITARNYADLSRSLNVLVGRLVPVNAACAGEEEAKEG